MVLFQCEYRTQTAIRLKQKIVPNYYSSCVFSSYVMEGDTAPYITLSVYKSKMSVLI